MANKIYLTGASGRLGSAVLAKVDAIPLVRTQTGLKDEIITDFSTAQLKKILADAKTIIHIAGSVDTLDKQKMHDANVELTKKIVESAPEDCRMIFAGSISVYGKKLAGNPANEATPVNPDSEYAKTKYEAENFISKKKNHVILRIGTIYGPQFEDYFRVLSYIEKNKMRIIGDGGNRIPFVHVDDVADVFRNALEQGFGVYVVVGEPLSQKEIYGIAARELGVDPPSKKISRTLALFVASIQELLYRIGGKKPGLTSEHISILGFDRAFDCSKAKKELSFSPRPLEQGIREIASIYKKRA